MEMLEQIETLNADQRREFDSLLDDIKAVFGSDRGKKVLVWILDQAGINRSVFTGNSKTYYNSGRQDFGQDILRMVNLADPEIYLSILRQRALDLKLKEKKHE
jgi:hypothetical protein